MNSDKTSSPIPMPRYNPSGFNRNLTLVELNKDISKIEFETSFSKYSLN